MVVDHQSSVASAGQFGVDNRTAFQRILCNRRAQPAESLGEQISHRLDAATIGGYARLRDELGQFSNEALVIGVQIGVKRITLVHGTRSFLRSSVAKAPGRLCRVFYSSSLQRCSCPGCGALSLGLGLTLHLP